MTESLKNWINKNNLKVEEKQIDDSEVLSISDVGLFLFLKPYDGKVIDEDFAFILSDGEFEIMENKKVDFILFEFGRNFYYSSIRQSKNKYNEIIYKPEFLDFKYLGESSEEHIVDFIHLGVHSEYEILNGSGNCSLWAKKAKFLGFESLGICDLNTLGGALSFQTACEKFKLKSVIGETIIVAKNYDESLSNQETFELKLYVLNEIGWNNLLKINSAINVIYKGFIPEQELFKFGSGLYCVISNNSDFNRNIDDITYCKKLVKKYKSVFDEVFYQIDTVEYSSETLFKKHLSNLDSFILNYWGILEPVLINDSYYLDSDEKDLKSILNKVAGVVNAEGKNQYFKSSSETLNCYSEWFDDVEPFFDLIASSMVNSSNFFKDLDFKIPTSDRKLPRFEVDDVESLFFEEIGKGVEERLKHLKSSEKEEYLNRLEVECNVIVPNGLCDYFMILWDIVKHCRENGVMVGSGRGSVCGSLVAYLLRITDVDPIKYNLLFERFLNETRVSGERAKAADSLPDVDLDFPTYYRDEVKKYISKKYGENYSCSIATFGRMKLKTCLKDFGKVKGLPFDKMNSLTKDIDDKIDYTWGDLFEYASRSKELFKFVQEFPDIVHMTKYALLQCKSASVHPSAIIIAPKEDLNGNYKDVFSWMPVKNIDGNLVSEWEGKYCDKSGFLKEDILGLSQLDKFQSIIKLIKLNKGVDVNTLDITFEDEDVFKYFKRGWCEDVFQFGTTGLMNYCRQVKPDKLDDLIAMTALFRPGPMESNAHSDFADIKNGKKKPKYDFGLKEVTDSTFGLYVYQEQIMKAVNVLGGLSLVEADLLRTIMKKKDKAGMEAMSRKFIDGAISRGCSEDEAKRIWTKLDKFSGYGFNKSHAAAYTIMSYWSQWFKVKYPLEFWTTSLQYSNESEIPYRLAELKKTGVEIEIRPPDVNFSERSFTCDKEDRIFFSLSKIKGVGDVAVVNIMNTREQGGKFFSLEEFLSRVPSKVNKTVVKNMIIAGAFDLIEDIKSPRGRKELLSRYLESKGDKLSEEYSTSESNSNAFWILEQKRLTGFGEVDYESMIRDAIPNKRIAKMYVNDVEFLDAKLKDEVTVAGKLIYYKEKEIKNGLMCTIQIDCNNTIIPILMWPDAYESISENITNLKGSVIAINGTVEKDKFKNEKKLYSNSRTKLYVISEHKTKSTKFEDWRNSKN